jgi:two-component system, NarL family, nitrate/nitrite response regulator NarL
MTVPLVKVAILEDHQSIIDGYLYRLNSEPKIQVVATIFHGEDLEPMLAQHQVDVLLLDVQVPISASNPNPYPILHSISVLLQRHRNLNILVISMHTQAVLIQSLVDAGVSGYIFKDDYAAIRQLARIILVIANGGIYFSEAAHLHLRSKGYDRMTAVLSPRQIEALSLCASYPDDSTAGLAKRLGVASSTLRNLLSTAYVRLGVHTRAAAIAKTRKLGLLPDTDIG